MLHFDRIDSHLHLYFSLTHSLTPKSPSMPKTCSSDASLALLYNKLSSTASTVVLKEVNLNHTSQQKVTSKLFSLVFPLV